MKLIVGLGNPGSKFTHTRHNTGRLVAKSSVGELINVRFLEPIGFYNTVGPEISQTLQFYKLDPADLLVIHDELDLEFGEMRLQFGKAAAGNHGVESIIAALGDNQFWRLRIGIGPRGSISGEKFVLERYSEVEEKVLQEQLIPVAKEMIQDWLNEHP